MFTSQQQFCTQQRTIIDTGWGDEGGNSYNLCCYSAFLQSCKVKALTVAVEQARENKLLTRKHFAEQVFDASREVCLGSGRNRNTELILVIRCEIDCTGLCGGGGGWVGWMGGRVGGIHDSEEARHRGCRQPGLQIWCYQGEADSYLNTCHSSAGHFHANGHCAYP